MIFVSDLDSTLIYSNRYVNNYPNKSFLTVVDKKNEMPISYMTKTSMEKLKKIASLIHFIPATMRSIDKYKRISIFNNDIKNHYAIVSNGGNIMINNEIDFEWKKRIDKELKGFLSVTEIVNKLKSTSFIGCINRIDIADEIFVYALLDENKLEEFSLDEIKISIKDSGWYCELQGKKVYFMPKCINKRYAIEYLRERLENEVIISAGDSILDIEMLKISNFSIIPSGGNVRKFEDEIMKVSSVYITKSEGIYSGEEILDIVLDIITNIHSIK